MAAIELNLNSMASFFIISRPQKSTLLVFPNLDFYYSIFFVHLISCAQLNKKKSGEKRNHTPPLYLHVGFFARFISSPSFQHPYVSSCSTARHAFVVLSSPLHKYLVISFSHPPSSILVRFLFFFESRGDEGKR